MTTLSAPVRTLTRESVYHDLARLRQHKPLVHNLTNLVTMQTIANVLLALGASPLMAHAPAELEDISTQAQALAINMGTLDEHWIQAARHAQSLAHKRHLPIIFDPVGAGASTYRRETALELLNAHVDIIRGNASEIIALTDVAQHGKGVDAEHISTFAYNAAQTLAKRYRCIVAVSGATDIIVDEKRSIFIEMGTPIFTYVTGMGCALTAVIAAFTAINPDYYRAAIHAMIVFARAGELAAKQYPAPGGFYSALLDQLFNLRLEDLKNLAIRSG